MFINRIKEISLFQKWIFKSKVASLVVVKGRRRIGKSSLIEEACKNQKSYRFNGLPPTSKTTKNSELQEFSRQYCAQFNEYGVVFANWNAALWKLAEQCKTEELVIFFDEISWMASKDHDFLGILKTAWDTNFKKNKKLTMVLCGSVSSWIEDNILNHTGFVGRISNYIHLEELPISECSAFWGKNSHKISSLEKLKIISVTGCIPRYLEEIRPEKTAEENIRALCFHSSGLLFNEFEKIFSDVLMVKTDSYKKIISCLIDGPKTIRYISDKTGLPINSVTTKYIRELVAAGFVSEDNSWNFKTGKKSKVKQLRIKDNYTRFYLKYIEPIQDRIRKLDQYNFSFEQLMNWNTIMGLQFENLVLNHFNLILDRVGILPNQIINYGPYLQKATKFQEGCQIDCLIQGEYQTLYVCEIKFSKNPIGKSVIQDVEKKIAALKMPKRFSIRAVLIHVNGIKDTVQDTDYFSEIIDFSQFLEK